MWPNSKYAADCHLEPIVCMQKVFVRYVCNVTGLTSTNPLFIKTGFLKFNCVFNLQICKLMQNTIREFKVDHNCFTSVGSVHSHYTRFLKKFNFVVERSEHWLALILLDTYVLSYDLVSQNIKN